MEKIIEVKNLKKCLILGTQKTIAVTMKTFSTDDRESATIRSGISEHRTSTPARISCH